VRNGHVGGGSEYWKGWEFGRWETFFVHFIRICLEVDYGIMQSPVLLSIIHSGHLHYLFPPMWHHSVLFLLCILPFQISPFSPSPLHSTSLELHPSINNPQSQTQQNITSTSTTKMFSIILTAMVAIFGITNATPVVKKASPVGVAAPAETTDWNNTPGPMFCAPEVRHLHPHNPRRAIFFFFPNNPPIFCLLLL